MNVRVESTGRIVHETSTSNVTRCGIMHTIPDNRASCEGIFSLTGAAETQNEIDCMACIVGPPVDTVRYTMTVRTLITVHYVEFTWTIE